MNEDTVRVAVLEERMKAFAEKLDELVADMHDRRELARVERRERKNLLLGFVSSLILMIGGALLDWRMRG